MAAQPITPHGPWVNQWLVESRTSPGKTYKVSQKCDGTWACDCPRWKFHKAPKEDCKHILGVKRVETKPVTIPKVKPQPTSASAPVYILQTRRKIILED